MVKGTTTVYLNDEIAKLARDLGLNISKTCENALKTAIARLQGNYAENNGEQQQINEQSNRWWTERDLNPRPPRCQRGDQIVKC